MSLPINLIILPFRNVHTHTLYVCLSRTLTLHSPTHPPHPPHTHGHSPASQGGSDLLSDHSSPSVPPLSAVLSGGSDQRDHHIGWLPPAPSQSTTHLWPDWAGNTASGCKGDGTKCECVGGWSVMVWSACSLGEWLLRLYNLKLFSLLLYRISQFGNVPWNQSTDSPLGVSQEVSFPEFCSVNLIWNC